MIRCACLLETKGEQIMLVRVRNNALWYLPGGTIEAVETAEQALIREIDEELGVAIDEQSMKFDRRIVGPALGRDGDVELNCYRARWTGDIKPMAEISEVAFIGYQQTDKMAPAIKILVDEMQRGQQS
ncbi:MAG: NUDIX domain-containing protein [Parasphingorhabdus sp.]|uniref:NUDIX hydrolase n=1 Tax=Parasphingorhabdus sp. TaxID=2709688 RepID=UPI0032985FBC